MRHFVSFSVFSAVLSLSTASRAQAAWQFAYPPQSPPASRNWSAAFDEARGEAVFVFPRSGATNQGWLWNGTTWSSMPGALPPNRTNAFLVYDVARQVVVLWGGQGAGGVFLQDLWEWDGTTWTQRVVAMPPARYGAGIAYDRARGVTVMFGGYGNGVMDDTWEWDGVVWTNPTPGVRPSPRESQVMSFEPVTQRVLLYGGSGTIDTWTWDGSVWQQHFPTNPPTLRLRPVMVADLARARVVLHGGSPFDMQTWEWNGSQWTASMPGSPGAILDAGGVYDTQRREVMQHGGEVYAISYTNQTWIYRTPTPATVTSFGNGCSGSTGVPQLADVPYNLPWIGDTVRTRVAELAAGSAGAVFVSSFVPSFLPMSLAPIGAPGCDLLLPPDVVEFETADGSTADWALTIPPNTSLIGAPIYQQAFPLEDGVNPLGVTASNGLRLVLGMR